MSYLIGSLRDFRPQMQGLTGGHEEVQGTTVGIGVCEAMVPALEQQVHARLDKGDLSGDEIVRLRTRVGDTQQQLGGGVGVELHTLLTSAVRRIDVDEDALAIDCVWNRISELLPDHPDLITATLPLGYVRTRKQQRMLIAPDDRRSADPATVRLIARAFTARKALLESPSIDLAAASLGYSRDYIIALARLSYLAPELVNGIVDGSIGGATKEGPLIRARLPLNWDEQRAMLMPA